jgi:hypothetical protein
VETFPIDHIAALELINCRNSEFDDAGLSGLGNAWDDSRASYRGLNSQYAADVAASAPTGFYRDNYNAFVQISQWLTDASNMSDMWMSSGNLDDSSYKNEMNLILTKIQGALEDLEAQMPAAANVASSNAFVGPPAPVQYTSAPLVAGSYASLVPPLTQWDVNQNNFIAASNVTPASSVAPQFTQAVQNNPKALATPQVGTVPVDPNSALAQGIANALSMGANVYTQKQIQSVLGQAQSANNPVYVPQSLLSRTAAGMKAKSSSSSWLIAGGLGVLVLGGLTWFALHRR